MVSGLFGSSLSIEFVSIMDVAFASFFRVVLTSPVSIVVFVAKLCWLLFTNSTLPRHCCSVMPAASL
jgi:hypothetical protein